MSKKPKSAQMDDSVRLGLLERWYRLDLQHAQNGDSLNRAQDMYESARISEAESYEALTEWEAYLTTQGIEIPEPPSGISPMTACGQYDGPPCDECEPPAGTHEATE